MATPFPSPTWRQSLAEPYPIPYFLHGALADLKTLKRVFQLAEKPRLKKARIVGYQRVRQVTNWILVPDDEQSVALLKRRMGEMHTASEVEGIMYMISNVNEADRLEKHAEAEYGAETYKTVTVNIEIVAQGVRRARNIEGRTIIYSGDMEPLEKNAASAEPSRDYAAKVLRARQLARKPVSTMSTESQTRTIESPKAMPRSVTSNLVSKTALPTESQPRNIEGPRPLPRSATSIFGTTMPRRVPVDNAEGSPQSSPLKKPAESTNKLSLRAPVDESPLRSTSLQISMYTTTQLPHSPSLNLATTFPRVPSYHGASIRGTQSKLKERGADLAKTSNDSLRDLNKQITEVYKSFEEGSKDFSHRSARRGISLVPTISKDVSTATKNGPQEGKYGPRSPFAHGRSNKPGKPRAHEATDKSLLSRASLQTETYEAASEDSSPRLSPRRAEDGSDRAKKKAIPKHYIHGSTNSGSPILSRNDKKIATGSMRQPVTGAEKVGTFVACKSDEEAEGYEADAEKDN
jgi:hypothetical protein